jgi:tetratricopeptide (TPR) repeat protein
VRRHPRLGLAAVAGVALVVVAGLSMALLTRNAQQAQLEAAALAQQFRDDARRVRVLLATTVPTDRERLSEVTSRGLRALDRYGIREQAAWWDRPAVRRLPDGEQQSLREEAGDLALLVASVTALQATSGEDGRRADGLRSALLLNEVSRSCYPAGKAPLLLGRQRARFRRLLAPGAGPEPEPTRAPAEASPSAKDLCLSAQERMDRGRYADAILLWRQAARLAPGDGWTWTGLGACYDNLGKFGDAVACYSTGIALTPEQDWLFFKRGVAYLRAANHEEALIDFDHFLAERPDVSEAYINRALAREGLKQYDRAIRDATKAIELGTTQTRVYFIRALLRDKAGDPEGARKDRESGLRLDPADDLSCVVRGLARVDSDPKAALADFDRALRFNPRSLDGLQNKASVLSEQLGRTADAVAVLDREIELYPEFVSARAGRGVLLARLGKRQPALRDAEECLRQDARPATLYQVAGIYALTSKQHPEDRDEALFLLSTALRKGYGRDLVGIDTDLDPIRGHPDFRSLVARLLAAGGKK